jgi:hypothetical protein
MAVKRLLVNLDAMITRADFAEKGNSLSSSENVSTISIRDFTREGLIGRNLRKPDFQRETNHWTPEQVVSLLECFLDKDLIPSVILWQSETFLFVIDGGHRLSVLRAWVEDDYGDGPISNSFFGDAISITQKASADKTRKLIAERIGSYQHYKTRIDNSEIDQRANSVISRGIPVQWVKGDADKAESSFFKINTQGTPLDDIEESLLKNRKRPIAIASRAVIRAGKGHKYWSRFDSEKSQKIEELARNIHKLLFDPELASPIKTLDLPLGGAKGIRTALQVLIEFFGIACINQANKNVKIDYGTDDSNGSETVEVLIKAHRLTQRITGNERGSLGLHPAIYFYGPSGVHSIPMFLGTCRLISEKLSNNDSSFFKWFSENRETIENTLIIYKDLIATILQKVSSRRRVESYAVMLSHLYEAAKNKEEITQEKLVTWGGVTGKIIVGEEISKSIDFSDETKSKIFIVNALKTALKCPLCRGFLDTNKSISYDHVTRIQDGGLGNEDNCQITHPYCNQGLKN